MTTKSKWPETVIFWGAGATYALGFPPTAIQGDLLIALSGVTDSDDYLAKLTRFEFFKDEYLEEMADLFYILDDDIESQKDSHHRRITKISPYQLSRSRALFSIEDEEILNDLIVNLRYNYDFAALKQIIKLCTPDKSTIVMSVFSLIDYHMNNNEGFHVKDSTKGFIKKHRLLGARNALVMIIVSCMTGAYLNALESKQEIIAQYKGFADKLAEYMQIEAEEQSCFPQNDREFYLFSYAIISLNWDHFLNWMIFHAHKEFNDDPANDTFEGRHIRLKFFNDFSILMGLRELNKENEDKTLTTKIWYPYNESVVQRINDPDYDLGKIVRIGKFYYPHGCLAWRACPNCGSITGTFGDEWSVGSESLFPPTLIPASRKIKNRPDNESKWVEDGWIDAIECSYCGSKTELKDTPLLMQTAVKSNVPPVLRIIQSDINACLENAKHIIFMGYSLPPDDLVWRSILLARKNEVRCTVILGYGGPNEWQTGLNEDEISFEGPEALPKELKTFFDLFGHDKLRFNTHGIPNLFRDIDIEDLLDFK